MGCSRPLLSLEPILSGEDCFEKLPDSLILRIFGKLSQGEGTDIQMMLRCAQVSSLWHRLALDGSNWQKVDLFHYQKDVKTITVQNISKRCGGFLRTLSLRGCQNIDDGTIEVFAANCTNIMNLNLSDCKMVSDKALRSLCKRCHQLKAINLYSCAQVTDTGLKQLASGCAELREIDVSFCHRISDAGVAAITSACPEIKRLVLRGTSISDEALSTIANNCTKLENISVSYCSISSSGLIQIAERCNNLNEIHCARCPNVTDSMLNALGRFTKGLKTLDVAGCNSISDHAVHSLASACPRLERIDLEECLHLSDATLFQFALHCPEVKEFALSHCENISDEGIRHLCSGELRLTLEQLDLDNCPLLTDISLKLLATCPNLRHIELVDCLQISKSGIEQLEKNLPNAKVHSYFAPDAEESTTSRPVRNRFCPRCILI